MTTPLESALIVAHVLAAVVGFGALGATGGYARAARRSDAGPLPAAVRRYFAPGRNLAGLALFLVPVFGVALLATGHWHALRQPFPWVGIGAWVAAAGLATAVSWPAEREIRALLAADAPFEQRRLWALARRCERAAGAAAVLFVVALAFMVVQPR